MIGPGVSGQSAGCADDRPARKRWAEIAAPYAGCPATPPAPQGAQIEGRRHQAPLSGYVVYATQQDSTRRLLLFDDPKDRLDQTLPAIVGLSGFVGAHPAPMTTQRCVVRPYLKRSPISAIPRTHPKDRTRSADGAGGPVEPHRYPTSALHTGEAQTLSLRTDVAAGLC